MLRCITIDELLPGMYVNQVLDDTGKVKVRSKGVVRSEKVIEVLRAKGVERVEIDCTKVWRQKKTLIPPIINLPNQLSQSNRLTSLNQKSRMVSPLTACKQQKPCIKRRSLFSSVFSRN